MGTHVNGPSSLKGGKHQLLSVFLGRDLSFLFKVLSCNQALSIQAHPCKKLARQLHASFPDIYKD